MTDPHATHKNVDGCLVSKCCSFPHSLLATPKSYLQHLLSVQMASKYKNVMDVYFVGLFIFSKTIFMKTSLKL